MEPLDEQADKRHDPVHPEDNADKNPVHNPDKQFQTTCVRLKTKELFALYTIHFYQITGSRSGVITSLPHPPDPVKKTRSAGKPLHYFLIIR